MDTPNTQNHLSAIIPHAEHELDSFSRFGRGSLPQALPSSSAFVSSILQSPDFLTDHSRVFTDPVLSAETSTPYAHQMQRDGHAHSIKGYHVYTP